MQITSAMKMVSAAKLRRAQDSIIRMRPYAEKIQEMLGSLSASLDVSENAYGAHRPAKKSLAIVVTSNRGLCGAFNNNAIKEARRAMNEMPDSSWSVLPIGKKAGDAFRSAKLLSTGSLDPSNFGDVYAGLRFESVSVVANAVMEAFARGEVDRVYVFYNRFKNAATQIVMREQFLPIVQPQQQASTGMDYIFVPGKDELVDDLIPKSLRIQLYKAVLDSNAAEHGARMTAMHKATDNASALKRELTLNYNKARQAAITNEILEIVAGAEALND
jgi:F-type H+-transporting ATPase subunit gamma